MQVPVRSAAPQLSSANSQNSSAAQASPLKPPHSFAASSPNAAPGMDADSDGQDNLLEWTAGLIPTDAGSVFELRMEASATQGALLIFSPIVSGRTYTVTYADDLLALPPWPALPGIPTTFDNGPERAVLDIDAHTVPRRFYRVEITKP